MLTPLSLFGLFAVIVQLIFYTLEDRGAWYVFGFAAACILGSIYGFLQGAWPFGAVEIAWTIIALGRFFKVRASGHPA
jgi:hypothetical protein